ncbi:hypothetical protein [Streptomyces sp. NPDC001759]
MAAALGTAGLILPLPAPGLRAVAGSVLGLTLVALMGLALATLLRDTAGAITAGLGLL